MESAKPLKIRKRISNWPKHISRRFVLSESGKVSTKRVLTVLVIAMLLTPTLALILTTMQVEIVGASPGDNTTYDFKDNENNLGWEYMPVGSDFTMDLNPNQVASTATAATQANYDAAENLDDSRWTTSGDVGDEEEQYYRFYIGENVSTIDNIVVTWDGYGNTTLTNAAYVYIWNVGEASWKQIAYNDGEEATFTWENHDNVGAYIDENGHLWVAASSITEEEEPSCPVLYTWNGDGWETIWEINANGGLGFFFKGTDSDNTYQTPFRLSSSIIEDWQLIPEDGAYKIKISEELPELCYFDKIDLQRIYHPRGTRLFTNLPVMNREYDAFSNPSRFFVVSDIRVPIAAWDDNNKDILNQVIADDGIWTEKKTEGVWKQLTFDFGDLSDAENLILLLKPEVDWYEGEEATRYLGYIEIWNGIGWDRADELVQSLPEAGGPEAYPQMPIALDITNWFPENITEHKLRFNDINAKKYDYVWIATSACSPYLIEDLSLLTANLYQEFEPTQTFLGHFTKFGEVKELLENSDDIYLVMNKGDAVEISYNGTFNVLDLFVRLGLIERSYVLLSEGYYKAEKMTEYTLPAPLSVRPLPFKEMSTFPYPENESFPWDNEHLEWWNEYQTRYIEPNADSHNTLYTDYVKVEIYPILIYPTQPVLYLPSDGDNLIDNTPYFEWILSENAENYRLLVDNDSDFSSPQENRVFITDNYYTPASENSLPDENYSWKVVAINENGENESSTWTFLISPIWITPPSVESVCAGDAENTIDDDIATYWQHASAEYHWIIFDMERIYDIRKIRLYQGAGAVTRWGLAQGLIVYVSENTTDWGDNVWEGVLNASGWQENGNSFLKEGRYIKLVSKNNSSFQEMYEFDACVAPPLPTQPILYLPADGAIMTDNTPYFEWENGIDADNHRLLVDNDNDFTSPEEDRIILNDNSYTIENENALSGGYYSWKVIAINENGEEPSDVWFFWLGTVTTENATNVGSDNATLNATITLTNVKARFRYKSENQAYLENQSENWSLSEHEYSEPSDAAQIGDWANRTPVIRLAANNSSQADKDNVAENYLGYQCDGEDDQVQIMDASDNLPDGGIILLSQGDYEIGSIILFSYNNQSLIGENADGTTVYTVSTSLSILLHIATLNILIENIIFSGVGRMAEGELIGIKIAKSNIVIRNVVVENVASIGIYAEISGSSNDTFYDNIWVRDSTIRNTGHTGIAIASHNNTSFFTNVYILSNLMNNVGLGSPSYGGEAGVVFHSVDNSVIANNTVENSGKGGIRISTGGSSIHASKNILVQGNKVRNNSRTELDKVGIQIEGSSDALKTDNIQVKGNDIDQFYAIELLSTAENSLIDNNSFYNTVIPYRTKDGAGHTIQNNEEPYFSENNYTDWEEVSSENYSKSVSGLHEVSLHGFAVEVTTDSSPEIFGDNLTFSTVGLGQPQLYYPDDNSSITDTTPTFEWTNGAGASYHRLIVNDNQEFGGDNEIALNFNVPENSYTGSLSICQYWWKVIAAYGDSENESDVWTFTIRGWNLVENWTGDVEAPIIWQLLETWTGTITTINVPPSVENLYITDMDNVATDNLAPETQYKFWVEIADNETLADIENITLIVYLDNENLADNTTNHYIVQWTKENGFEEVGPYGDGGERVETSDGWAKPLYLWDNDGIYSPGTGDDRGVLWENKPTENQESFCTGYVHYFYDGDENEFILDNVYYHVWWKSDADIIRFIYFKQILESYTRTSYLNKADAHSVVGDYSLSTAFLNALLSDDPLNWDYTVENSWNSTASFEVLDYNPNVISEPKRISFVIFNLPDDSTLESQDTDNDELNDYDELWVTFTNPYDSDTDNDGVSDYYEYLNGTDPNDYTDICTSHLIVENCENFDNTLTIDNIVFAIEFGADATVTANDNWDVWVQIYDSYGNEDNRFFLNQFDIISAAQWNLIETWTGDAEAPVAWQEIENWTGTVEAPAGWQLIETWSGSLEAPIAWQLIETWTGTIEAVSQWSLIETWSGTIQAPSVWQLIETWSGTVEAFAQWELVETWAGTLQAPTAWILIESWDGTVQALAAWELVETWAGTVEAPTVWNLIETWTGTVEAPVGWNLIETWTGTVEAFSGWGLVEEWSGTIEAFVEWQLIETWSGTIVAPSEWTLIETWAGTVIAPVAWELIETWTGTIEAFSGWQLLETWTGIVEAYAEWSLIETWSGTVANPTMWNLIETWTATVQAPSAWGLLETWSGTVEAFATWELVESWAGAVQAPTAWNLIESWSGTVLAYVEWQQIESWSGAVQAPSEWLLIETWTGTIESPTAWQLISTWTGTIEAPSVWDLMESWTGTIQAPSEWSEIENWTGGVIAVGWTLIETWGGTVHAPGWILTETWSGGIRTPAVYAVSISITPSENSSTLGDTLTYTVIVVNIGGTLDNYDLTSDDPQGWATYLDDNVILNVASGVSGNTTLNVGLSTLGTHTVNVTATSQGDSSVSDTASTTAISATAGEGHPGGIIGGGSVALGIAALAVGLAVVALIFVLMRRREDEEEED